jgi:hypothetical protein
VGTGIGPAQAAANVPAAATADMCKNSRRVNLRLFAISSSSFNWLGEFFDAFCYPEILRPYHSVTQDNKLALNNFTLVASLYKPDNKFSNLSPPS